MQHPHPRTGKLQFIMVLFCSMLAGRQLFNAVAISEGKRTVDGSLAGLQYF